jgi:cytochrome P450
MTTSRPFSTEHPFTTEMDISSQRFWSKTFKERDGTFEWLRKNAPVSWHPPYEDPAVPPEVHGEAGYWAVTLAKDIQVESQNYAMYSSAGRAISYAPQHPDLAQSATFLEMDPPRHTKYRQAISAAFTPKGVGRINNKICERAAAIIDNVLGAGEFDFVTEVSAKLPMLTIADMVGVPDSLTEAFAHAGDCLVGAGDPEILPPGENPIEFAGKQIMILREIGVDLVNHRRTHPADDIATALANHEVDGKYLTDDDIAAMMMLLSVAGNDTTKQTTSHTMVSLDRNPDQRAWLIEDFDGRIAGAIEEFIRHASPVIEFGRMATDDTELGGQRIAKGDKVVMFYCSGNRDESVFEDPHRFDLTRPRMPHVGFGGGGVHFCLGNSVAKAQLRALYNEILTKLPNIEVGEPELLHNEFIHGIRRLPVRVS